MRLMDLVLWNRVDNPKPFGAKQSTLVAVITAAGQFQGFQHYPRYDSAIAHNLQQMINIANNNKDTRAAVFANFISAAVQVASEPAINDPSRGTLTAWRTAGSKSPGPNFTSFKTVLGTTFYYT